MIVTLAGHVDHGKTAIVKALTGSNTDRLKEEQTRGLTIDLGFAYTHLGTERVGFVDVPGHHKFIHNMIAGVGSLQHALLIIAADDGIMPQTIEHVHIMELMGIESGTIVLNKIDLVSESRRVELEEEIQSFAASTFLNEACLFPTSTYSNEGVYRLKSHLQQTAESFKEIQSQHCFRMAIDRSFSLRGVGTVVTGTVGSGQVAVGDELFLTSTNRLVRVRNLNVQGEETSSAKTGDRCSVNIVGANVNEASRGAWLAEPESVISSSYAQVSLSILADFPRQLKHRSAVHIYHLTDHCEANIALLEANLASAGDRVFADIECSRSMFFKAGDRLIVRDRDLSRTLGGALVLNASSTRNTRRRSKRHLQLLDSLVPSVQNNDFSSAVQLYAADRCLNVDQFRRLWNESATAIKQLKASDQLSLAGQLVLHIDRQNSIQNLLIRCLDDFHNRNPDKPGLTLTQLTDSLRIDVPTLQFVVQRLLKRKEIDLSSGIYSLPGRTITKPSYSVVLFDKFSPLIDQMQPMSIGDIAKHCHLSFEATSKAIQGMVVAGKLVRVSKNRVFTPDRLEKLVEQARDLAQHAPFSVKNFRDESGLGRNLVIELLEYLDAQRITKREGDVRVVLPVVDMTKI